MSIPAFVVGYASETVTVPVYLYNDSLANIDSIAYTLSFDNSSNILSYEDGTFSGTVISGLNNGNIEYDDDNPDSISVYAEISEFSGAGIITYLDFILGVNNVYAGVPVIIGKDGVEKIEQIDLDDKEKKEFMHSIDAVKALWEAASKIDPDLSK